MAGSFVVFEMAMLICFAICFIYTLILRGAEPPYTILQEPPSGHPEHLVADVHLPNVVSVLNHL